MAKAASKKKPAPKKKVAQEKAPRQRPPFWRLRVFLRWAFWGPVMVVLAVVAFLGMVNPPTTHTIWTEWRRLGEIDRQWLPIEEVAPVMVRSVVAAEDANFCRHWGFDMGAIRAALDAGAKRGASTLSQQTVKNVFLWQGRSWTRKALEALLTPVTELFWSKRRILEVYLNVAEFDEGVFGIDAAAHHYFATAPAQLTATQAARLAVVLPNPKGRDPNNLSPRLRKRAAQVASGAATIRADGRAACFED